MMLSSIYTKAYRQALQMISSGVETEEILTFLTVAAEKASGLESTASIMVLDKDGLLRNAASPKLPADYIQAIDGIKPNPRLGTCAAAAATGEVVITRSFYSDNKWAELRHLPTAIGYVGAWSMPIKTTSNKTVGTFGTYFRKHREPSAEEIKGTELLASIAALLLASSEVRSQ